MKRLISCLAAVLWGSQLWAATVTMDGATTYQVIDGFGVNANHRSWKGDELKPVLDALIDQAGLSLFRVVFDGTDWEATNDNTDPAVMNWAYYNSVYSSAQFTPLWEMLAYLNSRGITNGAFFNFMGPGPQWLGGSPLPLGMEAEWAEMIASLLVYARTTRGLQFQLVAPDNEPDLSSEGIQIGTASQYLSALRQLAQKLDASGLGDVRLVGPDLALNPMGYLPELLADPVVMAKLAHFGVHRYGAGAGGAPEFIRNSPYPERTVWVTEFNVWCNGCDSGQRGTYDWDYCRGTADYLLSQLEENASAGFVWEGYDSFYTHPPSTWSFWGLFSVDDEHAAVKTYTPRKNFYTVAQVSRFVRPGARRINVAGSIAPFSDLVGFHHSGSGQVTLVGINPSRSAEGLSGTLASLPAVAHLELYYTSAITNLAYGGRVTVSNGTFSASIPADCVFTLSGFSGVTVALTNPANGARFNAPAELNLGATAASATGSIAVVEFYNGTIKLGESTVQPYELRWSNVPMGDFALSARATDTAGNARTSAVVNVAVVGPIGRIKVTPMNAEVSTGNPQQFTAAAFDQLGHPLGLQPSFSWAVSNGRRIDNTGLFTAGNLAGGPFQVLATSAGITGTATVSVVTINGGSFGNLAEGASADTLWDNGPWINACRFQAASNMVVSTVHAKVGAISGSYKCAIYADAGNNVLSFLRGTTELRNPGSGWQEFPLTAALVLTQGQNYWLAIWSDDANAQVYYSGTGGTQRWGRFNYGDWPELVPTTGGGDLNFCLFATGTGTAAPSLSSLELMPVSPTLLAGGSQQFTASGTFSDGSTEDLTGQVTWSSSDTSVATITASGLATAISPGAIKISSTVAGVADTNVLTVQAPRLAIKRTPASTVVLSWPAPAPGWVLEENSDLEGDPWTTMVPPLAQVAGRTQGILPEWSGSRFYRLKQVTNAPVLSMTHTGTNTTVISWSAPAPGWVLEQSSATTPGSWNIINTALVEAGGQMQLILPGAAASNFYRLTQVILPAINITRSSTNTLLISWPAPATGWALEESSTLAPANWTAVTNTPVQVGANLQVVLSEGLGARFFRLVLGSVPPHLFIANGGANTLLLSWPASATGWVLEESSILAPANWTAVTNTPAQAGAKLQLVLPVHAGARFYRLVMPMGGL